MKFKFKVGDKVQVITGKHRYRPGSTSELKQEPAVGRILSINKRNLTVVVEGLNVAKHHQKLQRQENGETVGGIVERERPIHLSNVMFVDPQTSKPVRLGIKVVDGKRVRYTKGRNASGAVVSEE